MSGRQRCPGLLTIHVKKLSHTAESDVKDDDFFLPEGGEDAEADDYRHLSADVREMLKK